MAVPGFNELMEAYRSGRQAYDDNQPRNACPYKDIDLRRLWLDGWLIRQEEDSAHE